MMLAKSLQSAAGNAAGEANYIEDVFSTWLYAGNGSTQTINNGIDLAGEGGMTWFKRRDATANHAVFDSARGINSSGSNEGALNTNTADPAGFADFISSYNSNGFSLAGSSYFNASGSTNVSWTFRKAPKFFDVVTFTTSITLNTISHNLDSTPGMIIVKRTDSLGDWYVAHRATANPYIDTLILNSSNGAASNDGTINDVTSSTFNFYSFGAKPATYVAYLFAHDAGGFGLSGEDNVISCGSYTGTGAAGLEVNLGFEPQWLLVKKSSDTGQWYMLDTMRGMPNGSNVAQLIANLSNAETSGDPGICPTATGFRVQSTGSGYNQSGATFVYIAIRRGPMKVPESGTSVFAVGDNTYPPSTTPPQWVSGFPVDMYFHRELTLSDWPISSRLQGKKYLWTNSTSSEADIGPYNQWGWMNGVSDYTAANPDFAWMFRRAPSFFDEVCYTGNGDAREINHNLTTVPEMMIVKERTSISPWSVYVAPLGPVNFLYLNTTDSVGSLGTSSRWNSSTPTSTLFSLSANAEVNEAGQTYVAYLFASCPGVSKVGSYTGTGASDQVINCGFTGGARFVMIKRTDGTSNWRVWDTARGIASGNDPSLDLNNTSAEETGFDQVDPDSSGFKVKANDFWNTSGANFIFLAIA